MELVEQLTILADIFYIEVNRLKKNYSNVIAVLLFFFDSVIIVRVRIRRANLIFASRLILGKPILLL